jgi:hypothetical protein
MRLLLNDGTSKMQTAINLCSCTVCGAKLVSLLTACLKLQVGTSLVYGSQVLGLAEHFLHELAY